MQRSYLIIFLIRPIGKQDRNRLMTLFFFRNALPFLFLVSPQSLPLPIRPVNRSYMKDPNRKWEDISRERSHVLIKTILALEKSARVIPWGVGKLLSSPNAKQARLAQGDSLAYACGALLVADGSKGTTGAELVMKVLRDKFYTETNDRRNPLNIIPTSILGGIKQALEAPHSSSFISFKPLIKFGLMTEIQQISEGDEFLVSNNIDLKTLKGKCLREACSKRLIGSPGQSEEELRKYLSSWLNLTEAQPKKIVEKTGLKYHGNLARFSLLCYNLVDSVRDSRSASYLPRLMYQGQFERKVDTVEDEKTAEIEDSKKRRKEH